MNDPNGMVYHEGEYHLFYQHYPDSTVWGPMHWGHAVSTDMVHWEHLPIALYPDELGYIFSGSAVVDGLNTSELGTDENPPIVAIYTYHDPEAAREDRLDVQSQGIAYSLDRGRSWTKYDGNPVLESPDVRDFRDPKVSWFGPEERWIMTLAVQDKISFYSSPDLKAWAFESDFGQELGAHGGVWECPDLFPLTVEGTTEQKWVLLVSINPGGPAGGSATQYFVGDFDGQSFTVDPAFLPEVTPDSSTGEERAVWLDYGPDNYAGVTWSDIPEEDGRRLFIGWMSNWAYAQDVPTDPWRSAMTAPRALTLTERGGAYRLASRPVRELDALVASTEDITASLPDGAVLDDSLYVLDVEGDALQGSVLILSNPKGEQVQILIEEHQIAVDRRASGLVGFSERFPGVHTAPLEGAEPQRLTVFVDLSSIEVFVNDGAVVMSELVFPTTPYRTVSVEGTVDRATVRYLKTIWRGES